jgi:hypothetical protein
VYIAQEETEALVLRASNPVLPPPTITFDDTYLLNVGGQVLQLDYHGNNYQPGTTFIYAPAQKVLMHVNLNVPGWAPFKHLLIAQDVPSYIEAFDETLAYDFDYLIAGNQNRVGTRADIELERDYVYDLIAVANQASQSVDYFASIQGIDSQNPYAQLNAYIDVVTARCVELMPTRYLTLLGGVDVFLEDNCFTMTESVRLDMVQPAD